LELLPIWRTPIVFTTKALNIGQTWGLVAFELSSPAPILEEREFGRLHDLGVELEVASSSLAEDFVSGDTPLEPLRRFRDEELSRVMNAVFHAGSVSEDGVESAAALLRNFGPRGLFLERYTSGGWGLRCKNLIERVAVELFDLTQHRPILSNCSICGRVFVPRGDESNCRWHIWAEGAKVGARPLLYCDQSLEHHDRVNPAFAEAEAAEHRREWSRLNMRVRRAQNRYERAVAADGPRSRNAGELRSRLREEEAAFAAFQRRPRGRRIALRGDDVKGD
jgi:hypothetical protein